jgi:hypothetical protein
MQSALCQDTVVPALHQTKKKNILWPGVEQDSFYL